MCQLRLYSYWFDTGKDFDVGLIKRNDMDNFCRQVKMCKIDMVFLIYLENIQCSVD